MTNDRFDSNTIYSGIADRLDSVDQDNSQEVVEVVGELAEGCATALNMLFATLGNSRETSLAITRLDEAWMWATQRMRVILEQEHEEIHQDPVAEG